MSGLADVVNLLGGLLQADHHATHAADRHRHKPAVKLAGAVAEVGDQPPMIALSAATLAIGLVSGKREVARGGLRMLAAHLVATGVKSAIKHQIDRRRPAAALESGDHHFRPGDSDHHDENSFPSGHTAGAVAVALAASRDIKRAAAPSALAATAIAATQPATGSHFLSDVVAGAAIGWVSEALVSAMIERIEPAIDAVIDRVPGMAPSATIAATTPAALLPPPR